jgi:phosphorylase kinase alpha/beta subunit
MGLEAVNSYREVIKTFHALLDILAKHECKIDWAIRQKPEHSYQYIHARYHPETFEEFWEEWGNKQNDAVGALLFKIFDLESKGIKVIRNEKDIRVLQKLVDYLESIEYWHDEDNGMWEENVEIHASSVGACVAGLKKASIMLDVPQELIKKGEETLKRLLPRESETKEADLALLSLIYPYNVVDETQKHAILKNIEEQLVRNKGLIRYIGDKYYNKNGEAEWTFGFPWLAKIYKEMNKPNKYAFYMRKTLEAMNEKGELPELYYANSDEHNENSPLGWSQAMFLVMVGE